MGRKLTPEEIAQCESQIANLQVALDHGVEEHDRLFSSHIASPALSMMLDSLRDQYVDDLDRAFAAAVQRFGHEALTAFIGLIATRVNQIAVTTYIAGYEMGRTGNKLLEFTDTCDHSHEPPSRNNPHMN